MAKRFVSNIDNVDRLEEDYKEKARQFLSFVLAYDSHHGLNLPPGMRQDLEELRIARNAWHNEPMMKEEK